MIENKGNKFVILGNVAKMDNSILKNIEIFKYLSPEEAQRVLNDVAEVHLEAGETVFEAGSAGNEMYIIKEGRIKVHRIFDGNEIAFAEFNAGDAFGEMSLIDEYPRSASATALEDCVGSATLVAVTVTVCSAT